MGDVNDETSVSEPLVNRTSSVISIVNSSSSNQAKTPTNHYPPFDITQATQKLNDFIRTYDELFSKISPVKKYNFPHPDKEAEFHVSSITSLQCHRINELSGHLRGLDEYFQFHLVNHFHRTDPFAASRIPATKRDISTLTPPDVMKLQQKVFLLQDYLLREIEQSESHLKEIKELKDQLSKKSEEVEQVKEQLDKMKTGRKEVKLQRTVSTPAPLPSSLLPSSKNVKIVAPSNEHSATKGQNSLLLTLDGPLNDDDLTPPTTQSSTSSSSSSSSAEGLYRNVHENDDEVIIEIGKRSQSIIPVHKPTEPNNSTQSTSSDGLTASEEILRPQIRKEENEQKEQEKESIEQEVMDELVIESEMIVEEETPFREPSPPPPSSPLPLTQSAKSQVEVIDIISDSDASDDDDEPLQEDFFSNSQSKPAKPSHQPTNSSSTPPTTSKPSPSSSSSTKRKKKRSRITLPPPSTKKLTKNQIIRYLGKYVQRLFEDGYYYGFISRYRDPYYLIIYEDGDMEELEHEEIKQYIFSTDNIPQYRRKACFDEANKSGHLDLDYREKSDGHDDGPGKNGTNRKEKESNKKLFDEDLFDEEDDEEEKLNNVGLSRNSSSSSQPLPSSSSPAVQNAPNTKKNTDDNIFSSSSSEQSYDDDVFEDDSDNDNDEPWTSNRKRRRKTGDKKRQRVRNQEPSKSNPSAEKRVSLSQPSNNVTPKRPSMATTPATTTNSKKTTIQPSKANSIGKSSSNPIPSTSSTTSKPPSKPVTTHQKPPSIPSSFQHIDLSREEIDNMTATQSLTNEDLALLQKSHKRSYQEFSDSRKPLPPPPVSKNTSDIITQQSKKPATVMASQPTKATTNTSKPATVTSSQPITRPPTTQPVRAIPPSNNREIASNHPPATSNKVQVSLVRRNTTSEPSQKTSSAILNRVLNRSNNISLSQHVQRTANTHNPFLPSNVSAFSQGADTNQSKKIVPPRRSNLVKEPLDQNEVANSSSSSTYSSSAEEEESDANARRNNNNNNSINHNASKGLGYSSTGFRSKITATANNNSSDNNNSNNMNGSMNSQSNHPKSSTNNRRNSLNDDSEDEDGYINLT